MTAGGGSMVLTTAPEPVRRAFRAAATRSAVGSGGGCGRKEAAATWISATPPPFSPCHTATSRPCTLPALTGACTISTSHDWPGAN